jgi:WD40 repeat protein
VLTCSFHRGIGFAHVLEAATGKTLAVLKGDNLHCVAAAFSSDGQLIATACFDRTVRLWNAETAKELFVLGGHEDEVSAVSFSPDNSRLVTVSRDKSVRLWDARTGDPLAVFRGHLKPVESAQFIADDRVLSVDEGGLARVWPADPLATARAHAPRELTAEERKQYEVPASLK